MKNIWKDIYGYEGSYQVSKLGQVRGLDRIRNSRNGKHHKVNGVMLSQGVSSNGYLFVILKSPNKKSWTITTHILVATAFILNPENKPDVNHKDGNKKNNHVDNLEWCTPKENQIHSAQNGLTAIGEKNGNHKLTEQNIIEIRSFGKLKRGDAPILAKIYNVDKSTIHNVSKNKQWNSKYLLCNSKTAI